MEKSTKHTLTFINKTDANATAQVWHRGSRVFNDPLPAGNKTIFTPGINKKHFNAVFKFDSSGAPKKLEIKDISLENKDQTVTCTGELFKMKKS